MKKIKVIILGCGSSGGVPRIGNEWGACNPDNPKNRRSRCSLYVEVTHENQTTTSILFDTAPDLREQLLRNEITHIDNVVYTHTHADQLHGIDDLRALAYRQRQQLPVFGSRASLEELDARFTYCFRTPKGSPYPPILRMMPEISDQDAFEVISEGNEGVSILPLDLDHGTVRCLGFRIGNMAYCNDVVAIPESSMAQLQNLDLFIIDTLRYEPHPSHSHLAQSLDWIEELKPKKAVLTNMHIDLDYDVLKTEVPHNVEPAYDGMTFEQYFP